MDNLGNSVKKIFKDRLEQIPFPRQNRVELTVKEVWMKIAQDRRLSHHLIESLDDIYQLEIENSGNSARY